MTARLHWESGFRALIARGLANPGMGILVGWALLKGRWCKLYYRLRGIRFTAGFNLQVYGRLVVRGPGEVVFGRNVRVFGVTSLPTYTPEARIVVGDYVSMESVRFGCVREILIGRDCILAESRIMDTDFHSVRADRHSPSAPVRVRQVRIEDNVWIGGQAAILPGTVIGENSVVGFGAVCRGVFRSNAIILGNPARVAAFIPSVEDGALVDSSAGPVAPSGA